eukprot:TRINITY_DN34422_c0_g1_i1.p1 TRINITY_DN34422_c0_g1~~TRINITY_DN34422_c0_g1_i1.p1  ORF type:complete len:329 (-),score=64.62 TRINITY_DN34422_c0_g1_i1:1102-2088(-)
MSLKTGFLHSVYEAGKKVAEMVSGPIKTSRFEKGMITPEEFVIAGDALVAKCPAWHWRPAPTPDVAVAYLPKNKQYIVISHVPCLQRAHEEAAKPDLDVAHEGEEWTIADADASKRKDEPEQDFSEPKPAAASGAAAASEDLDLDSDEDPTLPPKAAPAPVASEAPKAEGPPRGETSSGPRTYDVSITYDQHYATPRMWLQGYDASGRQLTEEEMVEDVFGQYSGETVTALPHPFMGAKQVAIHPCRHAEVMISQLKMLNARAAEVHAKKQAAAGVPAGAAAGAAGGEGAAVDAAPTIGVEQYLFIFLKFMTNAVPTIDYDRTRDLEF